ncbi:MAG: insulinase family protein [Bdellovibrionaceae bacterium]|nr:insulinase family protein [Pseudobdellovibrionaceae bacterium]MDW8190970.1 pitrilysin family protein [Pseudobdellovibrionaceae bacterium]
MINRNSQGSVEKRDRWLLKGLLSLNLVLMVLLITTGCIMTKKGDVTEYKNLNLKGFKQEVLENGLTVIWIPDVKLPRVSLQLMVQAGSVYESPEERGFHALTASLFGESTLRYTALELNQKLEQFGFEFGAASDTDYSLLSISGLSPYRFEMLDLFVHILLESKFDVKDFERKKQNTLTHFKRALDDPSTVASLAIGQTLYGNHPYGGLVSGTPKTVTDMKVEDCLRIYKVFYQPHRARLVVSGRWNEKDLDEIRRAFVKWRSFDTHLVKKPQAVAGGVQQKQIWVFHKPKLEQTQIRFAHLSVPQNHPDFLKMRVANITLGGAFASRLLQVIRDDLGLTYSVHSSTTGYLVGGHFQISTFTRHEKVRELVEHVHRLFKEFVEGGITEKELRAAQSVLIGQFPGTIETPDQLGNALLTMWIRGMPEDYLSTFQSRVASFNLEEINQVIKKYFYPDQLSTVIYTDFDQVKDQLKALNVTTYKTFNW